ncbi:alkaline phosphatase family protein [Candidatus Woesearchaeota archaeon]|nr:alkaline phosphatase family protein [Candidatus Woesearchaeota archaeon]
MLKPEYYANNTVNLMSSIIKGLGGKNSHHSLTSLSTEELASYQNVVLMVIDAMGKDSMVRLGENSFFNKHRLQVLQSVFPSTTIAAVSTFLTGLTPQEHGYVAWYMKLKEFGKVCALLPFYDRNHKHLKGIHKIKVQKSIFAKIKVEGHTILKKNLKKSPYNNHWFSGKNTFWGYTNLKSFSSKIRQAVVSSKNKKYIYAYWPGFDDFSHEYGKTSVHTLRHLCEVERVISDLSLKLKGSNSLILITADHGQIVTTKEKTIILEEHAKLKECLSERMAGEPRAVFFEVKTEKRQQFEHYMKHNLGYAGDLFKSKDLADLGYFGLGKEHLNFRDRIGEYIFLMKENYAFREFKVTKDSPLSIGHHGGLSQEEMLVPLVKVVVK